MNYGVMNYKSYSLPIEQVTQAHQVVHFYI